MHKNILLISLIVIVLCINSVVMTKEQIPQNLIMDAKEFYAKGQFLKAIELYRIIIEKYPENSNVEESLFWLGNSYESLGNIEQAITNYDLLLLKFPKSKFGIDTLRKKANILIKVKNFKQTAEALETLISRYPESIYSNEAGLVLGDIYGYKLNDFDKALIWLKKYKALDHEKADINFKIRFFEDNRDFSNEPLKMYCAAKQENDINKLESAEATLKKLIVNYPKSKIVDDALLLLGQNEITKAGWLYRNTSVLSKEQKDDFLKYYKIAADYYNQVIRDYPENETSAEAKYYIAQIYDWDYIGGLNNFDMAIKKYQVVIDDYKETYWADKAKQRLKILKQYSR